LSNENTKQEPKHETSTVLEVLNVGQSLKNKKPQKEFENYRKISYADIEKPQKKIIVSST